ADGAPVLVDFGLATGGTRGHTIIKGYTATFAPLEQLRGRTVTARGDVYSLAATLWYALTLEEPDRFRRHRLPPGLEALGEVLAGALDHEEGARPGDAAELARLLGELPAEQLRAAGTQRPAASAPVPRVENVPRPDLPPGRWQPQGMLLATVEAH